MLDFRNANFEGTRRELGALDWENQMSGQCASEKRASFKEQLCSVQSRRIPLRRKGRGRKRPGGRRRMSKDIRIVINDTAENIF